MYGDAQELPSRVLEVRAPNVPNYWKKPKTVLTAVPPKRPPQYAEVVQPVAPEQAWALGLPHKGQLEFGRRPPALTTSPSMPMRASSQQNHTYDESQWATHQRGYRPMYGAAHRSCPLKVTSSSAPTVLNGWKKPTTAPPR